MTHIFKKLVILTAFCLHCSHASLQESLDALAQEYPSSFFRVSFNSATENPRDIFLFGTMHIVPLEKTPTAIRTKLTTLSQDATVHLVTELRHEGTLEDADHAETFNAMKLATYEPKLRESAAQKGKDSSSIAAWKEDCLQKLQDEQRSSEVLHPAIVLMYKMIGASQTTYQLTEEGVDASLRTLFAHHALHHLETDADRIRLTFTEEDGTNSLEDFDAFELSVRELKKLVAEAQGEEDQPEGQAETQLDEQPYISLCRSFSANPLTDLVKECMEDDISEIIGRNKEWHHRIDDFLAHDSDPYLFAVGIAHLGGETGLLRHFVTQYKADIFQLLPDGTEKLLPIPPL